MRNRGRSLSDFVLTLGVDDLLDADETWVYTCSLEVTNDVIPPTAVAPPVTADQNTSEDWSDYQFVFFNMDTGEFVTVNGSNSSGQDGHTGDKNRAAITINGDSFEVHVSCSDSFSDGIGYKDGPDGNPWKVSSYAINKYKDGDFDKTCGDSPLPVPDAIVNTATVTAKEFDDGASLSDTDSATIALV